MALSLHDGGGATAEAVQAAPASASFPSAHQVTGCGCEVPTQSPSFMILRGGRLGMRAGLGQQQLCRKGTCTATICPVPTPYISDKLCPSLTQPFMQGSAVAFLVHLDNGAKVIVRIYLCFDDAREGRSGSGGNGGGESAGGQLPPGARHCCW